MNDEIENKALRARNADLMARIDAAMDAIEDNYTGRSATQLARR